VSLVLDSSATLAWIYSDETTESIRALFDRVIDEGAIVPALWRLEVANSLTVAVRRSRIDVEFRRAALADLAHLDISTDEHTNSHAWSDTLHLAAASDSHFTTRPIWNSRSAECCHWPHWITNCALPRERLALKPWASQAVAE